MAQQKKKWVAFKTNAIVPGGVLGENKDQKMQAGEPVQLPEGYADHVVADGFASFCDAPKRDAQKKSSGPSVAEKADAAAAAKLQAARARVDDLAARMDEIGEGGDGFDGLLAEFSKAEAALAALQPAA